MGGSGGGGGDYRGGGGGGGEPPKQDCGSLRFTTTLEQPIGVPEHRRGTVLELLRAQDDGRPVIAAVDDDGTVIGTVTDELPALLRCTGDGWAFVAEVITVNYGVHSVVVRAADRVAVTAVAYTAAGGPASLEPVVLVDARHHGRRAPAYRGLAELAGCSASRAFTAVHRLTDAGLLRMDAGAGSLAATVDLVADSRRLR